MVNTVRRGFDGDVECQRCGVYWPGHYDRDECQQCGSVDIEPLTPACRYYTGTLAGEYEYVGREDE